MKTKEILLTGAATVGASLGIGGEMPSHSGDKCIPFDEAANIVYHPLFWDEDGNGGQGNYESIFAQKSLPGDKGYVDENGVVRSFVLWNQEEDRFYTDAEVIAMDIDPMIAFERGVEVEGFEFDETHPEGCYIAKK
jgi:hypothetical protein